MLERHHRLAIFVPGRLAHHDGKMAHGVLRYAPHDIVAVIDPANAGRRVPDVIEMPRDVPVVADVDAAVEQGADTMLIGIAPPGGLLPEEWLADMDRAVAAGLNIVNGLHQRLAPRYDGQLEDGQWIWDMRQEPPGLNTADRRVLTMNNLRILLVGTDMACGKMTTALELDRLARERGQRSVFIATGQIGVTISGRGVCLDAVRLDYSAGAIERCILDEPAAEIVFVEGQGSLLHPASSATLPLLRGACPTHLVLCHRAGSRMMRMFPDKPVPDLRRVATAYEDVAEACGLLPRPVTVGIALNTGGLAEAVAREEIAAAAAATGLPVTDCVRFGAAPILDAIGNFA